jgi:hypothetical protein
MTDWTFHAIAANGTYEVGCNTALATATITHTMTAGNAALYPMLGGCTPAPMLLEKTMGATVSGTMQISCGIPVYLNPTVTVRLTAVAGNRDINGCAFLFWIPVVMTALPGDAPLYDGCARALTVQNRMTALAGTWMDWLPYSCSRIYGTPPMLTVYRQKLTAVIEKDTKLT